MSAGVIAASYVAAPPPVATFATVAASKSPDIWLRLGEASGTTAADASGNGFAGSYFGAPGLGTSGLLHDGDTDTAATFSGDDRVVVPYDAAWGDDGMSFFLRAKPATVSDTRQILTRRSGTTVNRGGFTIRMDAASLVFYPFPNYPGNTITLGTLTAGREYSVGVTYNVALGRYEAYLDGILVRSRVTTYRASTIPLSIGSSYDSPIEGFLGVVDELLYWNTPLTAADYADLHAAATTPSA